MTLNEKWIRKELGITGDKAVGNITLPIGVLAILLDSFYKHKQMEDTCPNCGHWPMMKINNEYKCDMCQVK